MISVFLVETTWFPQGIAGRWLGKPIIELIEASEKNKKGDEGGEAVKIFRGFSC